MSAPAPGRVLVVSRDLPRSGVRGNATYLLALLDLLARSGVTTDLLVLEHVPTHAVRLDRVLQAIAGLHVPGMHRVGSHLLRTRPARSWISAGLRAARTDRRTLALRRAVRRARNDGAPSTKAQELPDFLEELSATELEVVRRTVADARYDTVVANYASMASAFAVLAPGVHRVVVAHDVWSARFADLGATGVPLTPRAAAWDDGHEGALLRLADAVVAIQAEDAAAFRRLAPDVEVHVVPMPVQPRALGPDGQVPGRVLFVGSQARANVQGMQWFLDEVWPRVRADRPDATLHVCGRVCRSLPVGTPGVELLGRVEDLTEEYRQAQVCVVPYLVGSGLKIKLVEAMAHGRATVSTDSGLQGVDDADDVASVRANAPQAFADAVVGVLRDSTRRNRLEQGAAALVDRRFSPAAVGEAFLGALSRPP